MMYRQQSNQPNQQQVEAMNALQLAINAAIKAGIHLYAREDGLYADHRSGVGDYLITGDDLVSATTYNSPYTYVLSPHQQKLQELYDVLDSLLIKPLRIERAE